MQQSNLFNHQNSTLINLQLHSVTQQTEYWYVFLHQKNRKFKNRTAPSSWEPFVSQGVNELVAARGAAAVATAVRNVS